MTVEETIDTIAERLKTMIGDIPRPSGANPVKPYKWAAGRGAGFDSVPAAVIQIPRARRTGIDEPEDHLGRRDLRLQYEVFFVFDAGDVVSTMPQSVEVVSAFIEALDADPTLSGAATEAKVTEADPRNVEGTSRPRFGYACTVDVLAFI